MESRPANLDHIKVTSVTSDSRKVQPGSVFVAIRGARVDGHKKIPEVQQKGAAAIVGESDVSSTLVPFIRVQNSRKALAELCTSFYDFPARSMKMIGVTGTSGKTTTTYLLESIFEAAGEKVGVIGTVNTRSMGKVLSAEYTTPGPEDVQRFLYEMKESGVSTVVMEVSSHGLAQFRPWGISFDGLIFTNLSPEHLDYHQDMEEYFSAKKLLFTEYVDYSIAAGKKPKAIVNQNDPFGKRLLSEISCGEGFLEPTRVQVDLNGIQIEASGNSFESPLLAEFNVENLLSALSLSAQLGVSSKDISEGIANLKGIPGRLENVSVKSEPRVLVDYAHKPDALEKVLKALNPLVSKPGRLITVMGCGGDRDRTKRPVMGKIACEQSDHVWITSDNPRTEDPQKIIDEILNGISGNKNYTVEIDREKAISEAIRTAQNSDLVLIAGKGHEDYQILGTQKVHFDDREVARKALDGLRT